MAAPKTTVWDLDPHSRAKHEILKCYLQAWMAILGQSRFPEFVYIDGFAGPGRYSKGEEGSPVIALRAALGRQALIKPAVAALFVSAPYSKFAHLVYRYAALVQNRIEAREEGA